MSKEYTVRVPGGFGAWFEGTGIAQGQDDSDPECKETRIAWENRVTTRRGKGVSHRVSGSRTVLKLLREYAETCVNTNMHGEMERSEMAAAQEVIKRVNAALSAAS